MEFADLTDEEIERLLSGSAESDEDLGTLAAVLEGLRGYADAELTDETVAGFVAAAAAAAEPGVATRIAPRRSLLAPIRQRAAAVAVGATVFLGSMTGLAAAADGAKPGDVLYGIDRAFEAVGIGNGAAAERFAEVESLVDAGEVRRGLQHAAETVDKHGLDGESASVALRQAAERVQTQGSDQSEATRERVAGLLTYISENVGDLDGSEVAELARGIGGPDKDDDSPDAAEPKAPGPPDHVPADPPGHSDRSPGPPDHAGDKSPGPPESKPGPPESKPGPPESTPGSPGTPNNRP
jgi:hypothetical protein